MLEFSFIICKIQCSYNEMRARERVGGYKEGGGTFNKLSHSESDKHQVSLVSDFHCESSKPEGSSLRHQLFHGVRARGWFSLARVLFSAESRRFQRRKCKIH